MYSWKAAGAEAGQVQFYITLTVHQYPSIKAPLFHFPFPSYFFEACGMLNITPCCLNRSIVRAGVHLVSFGEMSYRPSMYNRPAIMYMEESFHLGCHHHEVPVIVCHIRP